LNWNALAIDGPGGAGKSGLATQLANDLGATIIQMDAFLLPDRKYRISAMAKNYDLDCFFEEVTDNLLAKKDIRYRVMDLLSGELKHEKVTVPAGQKVIVEGIYSLELSFRDSYLISGFQARKPTWQLSIQSLARCWLWTGPSHFHQLARLWKL